MADCQHEDVWFDRSICPEPCGMMHDICDACGKVVGYCYWMTHEVVQRRQNATKVMDTLSHLDGSQLSAVASITGLTVEELESLGGLEE